MPSTADDIVEQLNAVPRSIPQTFEVDLLPGHRVGTAKHLFSKIDNSKVGIWRAQFGGTTTTGTKEEEDKPSKKALIKAKKLAAKSFIASKSLKTDLSETNLPSTPEQLLLEERIAEQGAKVKGLKGEVGVEKSSVEEEVKVLLGLKEELKGLTRGLEELKVVD